MMQALNNHDINGAEECFKKIVGSNVNNYLKKRARIAIAFLKNDIKKLDESFINSIIEDLNKSDNWVFNIKLLKLFSTAMIILPSDYVEVEINILFEKINRNPDLSESMQERYAIICSNYLHWKYDNTVNKEKLKYDENAKCAIKYMLNLESTAHNLIYILSGKYYLYLFLGDKTKAKGIKESLINMGCEIAVKNWPV